MGLVLGRRAGLQYYLDGHTATEADFLSPKTLDKLLGDSSAAVNLTRSLYGSQPVWLGETSSAYGGGAPGVSNKFTSTFLWLDKLGVAGAEGVTLLARQDFFGGTLAGTALLCRCTTPISDAVHILASIGAPMHRQLRAAQPLQPRAAAGLLDRVAVQVARTVKAADSGRAN